MPVLYTQGAFDYISLMNYLYGLSPFLVITRALGDEQNLTSWMNMPIQLCAGTISGYSDRGVEGTVSYT